MQKRNGNIRHHLIEIYLPVYYMLSMYSRVFIIGLGDLILLLLAVISINKNSIFRVKKRYLSALLFLLYAIVIDVFRGLTSGAYSPIYNAIHYTICMISAIILTDNKDFDEDILYKSWYFFGTVFTIGLVFQLIEVYVLGKMVSPISIVPGIALGEGAGFRPSSFFSEPAAFASSLVPLIFLLLKRHKYIPAMVFTFAIVSTTSTVGIILLAVLWICMIFSTGIKNKYKVLLIGFLTLLSIWLSGTSVLGNSIDKLLAVTKGESTFVARVSVGFELVKNLSLKEFIIGVKEANIYQYISQNIYKYGMNVSAYYSANRIFLNTFCNLIVNYGVIGFVLYLRIFVSRLRDKTYLAKPLIIVNFVAIFGQSVILNSLFYQLLIILFLYDIFQQPKDA